MVSMDLLFEPLSLEKADRYRELYEACPRRSSYYSFGSLWAWRNIFGFSWAFREGMCWIRTDSGSLWAPRGPPGKRRTGGGSSPGSFPGGLVLLCAGRSGKDMDGTLPGQDRRPGSALPVGVPSFRPGSHRLRGNRFSRKRSHIRQFVKHYAFRYRSLGSDDGETILAAQRLWLSERPESPALLRENGAVEEMVREWRNIPGLLGGLLEVDGMPAAYTIAEAIPGDTVMIHFEKALSSYNGAYQAINRLFLQNTAPSFTTVNREEDLGDEGMRVAKMSYHPVGFLKKYTLSWFPD